MKITPNDACSVVLTQLGADILNSQNSKANEHLDCLALKQNYAVGDIYKAQLWHLMKTFGDYCHLGSKIPFSDMYFKEEPPNSSKVFRNLPKKVQ